MARPTRQVGLAAGVRERKLHPQRAEGTHAGAADGGGMYAQSMLGAGLSKSRVCRQLRRAVQVSTLTPSHPEQSEGQRNGHACRNARGKGG